VNPALIRLILITGKSPPKQTSPFLLSDRSVMLVLSQLLLFLQNGMELLLIVMKLL